MAPARSALQGLRFSQTCLLAMDEGALTEAVFPGEGDQWLPRHRARRLVLINIKQQVIQESPGQPPKRLLGDFSFFF